jgi:hypothetical protein
VSAPLFHAATAEMRRLLWEAYAEFVGRFRDAAEKLRAGDRTGEGLGVTSWTASTTLGSALHQLSNASESSETCP